MYFKKRIPWFYFVSVLALFLILTGFTELQAASEFDQSFFETMKWRSIGPYRGGRVTTVAGVPGNPLVYYMGTTGGGVWKTKDAGQTWFCVSDGYFKTGSIGAVAVSESDPNVI